MLVEIISSDNRDRANFITPVDLFFLENWDESSNETVAEQRIRLSRDYVALGFDGRDPYRQTQKNLRFETPTAAQIELLRQISSAEERRITSWLCSRGCELWLRTFYTENSELLSTMSDMQADGITGTGGGKGWTMVLDDVEKYNFGERWEKILDIFPEIVGCRVIFPDIDSRDSEIEHYMEEMESAESEWDLAAARTSMEWNTVTGGIFIQDQESEESHEARHLWLDEFGTIIREARYGISLCETLGTLRYRDVEEGMFESATVPTAT